MTYNVVFFTGVRSPAEKTFGPYKCAHELRQAGFSVLVVNYLHYLSLSDLKNTLDLAVGDNTLFVGFSNTFIDERIFQSARAGGNGNFRYKFQNFLPNPQEEAEFTDYVKSINPNCKIVVGGARTFFNINNPCIDYAIVGYADLSIVNLAQHLSQNTELKNARRNTNRITVITDQIAEGFDFNNSTMTWTDDDIVISGETLPLELTRGCIFSCKFCSYPLNGRTKFDYIKNPELIKQELIHNYEKYNITQYRFLDDTFNDVEQKIDVMLEISKSLPFKLQAWAYVRLDLLAKHPGTIAKLVDLGLTSMYFGIETLNQKTGRIIGKGYNPADQINTLNHIKDTYGNRVHITASFICGLPEESMDSVRRTMDLIADKKIRIDECQYRPLNIIKQNYQNWHSAFNLDMTKYGYREMPGMQDHDREQVIWENNYTNFIESQEICNQFAQNVPTTRNVWSPFTQHTLEIYKTQLFQHLRNKSNMESQCTIQNLTITN
jgi:radical SAM superfamily enzyme YgiQ (UPF0313 family)